MTRLKIEKKCPEYERYQGGKTVHEYSVPLLQQESSSKAAVVV